MNRLAGAVIALLPLTAIAAPAPTAQSVRSSIQSIGAAKTVARLDALRQLDAVMARIGRGDQEWIALAPLLAPGADAAASEGLGISLAQALPANPAAVLRVLNTAPDDALSVETVCGIPFIESPPGYDEAYKIKAIAAVMKVTPPALQHIRTACLLRLKS